MTGLTALRALDRCLKARGEHDDAVTFADELLGELAREYAADGRKHDRESTTFEDEFMRVFASLGGDRGLANDRAKRRNKLQEALQIWLSWYARFGRGQPAIPNFRALYNGTKVGQPLGEKTTEGWLELRRKAIDAPRRTVSPRADIEEFLAEFCSEFSVERSVVGAVVQRFRRWDSRREVVEIVVAPDDKNRVEPKLLAILQRRLAPTAIGVAALASQERRVVVCRDINTDLMSHATAIDRMLSAAGVVFIPLCAVGACVDDKAPLRVLLSVFSLAPFDASSVTTERVTALVQRNAALTRYVKTVVEAPAAGSPAALTAAEAALQEANELGIAEVVKSLQQVLPPLALNMLSIRPVDNFANEAGEAQERWNRGVTIIDADRLGEAIRRCRWRTALGLSAVPEDDLDTIIVETFVGDDPIDLHRALPGAPSLVPRTTKLLSEVLIPIRPDGWAGGYVVAIGRPQDGNAPTGAVLTRFQTALKSYQRALDAQPVSGKGEWSDVAQSALRALLAQPRRRQDEWDFTPDERRLYLERLLGMNPSANQLATEMVDAFDSAVLASDGVYVCVWRVGAALVGTRRSEKMSYEAAGNRSENTLIDPPLSEQTPIDPPLSEQELIDAAFMQLPIYLRARALATRFESREKVVVLRWHPGGLLTDHVGERQDYDLLLPGVFTKKLTVVIRASALAVCVWFVEDHHDRLNFDERTDERGVLTLPGYWHHSYRFERRHLCASPELGVVVKRDQLASRMRDTTSSSHMLVPHGSFERLKRVGRVVVGMSGFMEPGGTYKKAFADLNEQLTLGSLAASYASATTTDDVSRDAIWDAYQLRLFPDARRSTSTPPLKSTRRARQSDRAPHDSEPSNHELRRIHLDLARIVARPGGFETLGSEPKVLIPGMHRVDGLRRFTAEVLVFAVEQGARRFVVFAYSNRNPFRTPARVNEQFNHKFESLLDPEHKRAIEDAIRSAFDERAAPKT